MPNFHDFQLPSSLVIATTNAGKTKEFAHRFAPIGITIRSLADYPAIPAIVEDGDTFADNAEIKARAVAMELGQPALADDSGLCVDRLDGAPGVYSARYAGEHATDSLNIEKLLRELKKPSLPLPATSKLQEDVLKLSLPDGATVLSAARFECALVLIDPVSDKLFRVEGSCPGYIIDTPRGDNGFGYDPVFYLPAFGRTMAELTVEEKQAISHRGKAMDKLLAMIKS